MMVFCSRKLLSRTAVLTAVAFSLNAVAAPAPPVSGREDRKRNTPEIARSYDDFEVLEKRMGNRRTTIHRGKSALAVLQKAKGRHAEPFARAEAALRARGYRPTEHVVAIETVRDNSAVEAADLTINTDEGIVILASWDDGDNATWEGTLYAENSVGSTMSTVGQIDLTTTAISVMWEELTFLNHLDPPPVVTVEPSVHRGASSMMSGREFLKNLIDCWLTCALGSLGCTYAGPAAPECFALVLTGCLAGCPIVVLLRKI